MIWRRFRCYLAGGVLAETGRDHHGARDPADPVATSAAWLPGRMYFATESAFWGGGRALYDPFAPGIMACRAWLITPAQFCDVLAQEMRRVPGADLDLPLVRGGSLETGPGPYETITCAGSLRGYPVVTFGASWRMGDVKPLAPAPAYQEMIAAGLHETFGWDARRALRYLGPLT
jgi:hypothetical protein